MFCLTLCNFVLMFFSPFTIAITLLGEERANPSAFRTFVLFTLDWFCLFPLPLGVWEELLLMIMALPGLFCYLFRKSFPKFIISILLLEMFSSQSFVTSIEVNK